MLELNRRFCTGKDAAAKFLTIYIEEAHAADEWYFHESEVTTTLNTKVAVHRNIHERIAAAKLFKERTKPAADQLEVVCDSMKGHVIMRYEAWPERLYIIVDGVVVYKGGIGPFDYRLYEARQWLEERFPHL